MLQRCSRKSISRLPFFRYFSRSLHRFGFVRASSPNVKLQGTTNVENKSATPEHNAKAGVNVSSNPSASMSPPAAEASDMYPSRKPGQNLAFTLPRLDPVVWTQDWSRAPLSQEQVQHFDRNGFLLVPGFFNHDVTNQVLKEVDHIQQKLQQQIDECGGVVTARSRVVTEPETNAVKSVFEAHTFSPLIDRLTRHPSLLAIARFIVGDDVYIHQGRVNYQPAFQGKGFQWHSDFGKLSKLVQFVLVPPFFSFSFPPCLHPPLP